MYSEERMLVWRFIFFCNERKLFAERPLMLDTAFQLINDFDEAEHARRTLNPEKLSLEEIEEWLDDLDKINAKADKPE